MARAEGLLGGVLGAEQLERAVRCGTKDGDQDQVRPAARTAAARWMLPRSSISAGTAPTEEAVHRGDHRRRTADTRGEAAGLMSVGSLNLHVWP